jgi:hypothetical protein
VSTQNAGPLPDLTSFYKFILSQPDGAANLANLASIKPPKSAGKPTPSDPEFTQQTSASGSLISAVVYERATVTATALALTFTGNLGGITIGIPAGATL